MVVPVPGKTPKSAPMPVPLIIGMMERIMSARPGSMSMKRILPSASPSLTFAIAPITSAMPKMPMAMIAMSKPL